jgi:hypothetical protein
METLGPDGPVLRGRTADMDAAPHKTAELSWLVPGSDTGLAPT